MLNVKMEIEDEKTLVIRVDLEARHGRSKSGKTMVVASTQGNQSVPDHPDVKIGLNVYTYGE